MLKGNDIRDRLLAHAVETTRLCADLPKNRATTHIAGQLLRSGTAAAPNYAEARAGESRQDFIHKLGIVLKELNESLVWLEMLRRMEAARPALLEPLITECDQLCRIIAASIKTASSEKK
jgi:four helix bundle protein